MILKLIKFIRIGRIIFNMTGDALDVVRDNRLSDKEKGIEILKALPNSLLELGKN